MNTDAPAPRLVCRVRALYAYTAQDGSSLSFKNGDIIDVLAQLPSGWWDGLCNGTRGWFPSNYTQVIEDAVDAPAQVENIDAEPTLPAQELAPQQEIATPASPSSSVQPPRPLFDDQLSLASSSWTAEKSRNGDTYNTESDPSNTNAAALPSRALDDTTAATSVDVDPSSLGSRNGSIESSRLYSIDSNMLASSGDDYDDEWLDDEQRPLPAPWIHRSLPQGGTCFYNMTTHEIAWDINDIRPEKNRELSIDSTNSQGSSDAPRPYPRSPARRMSSRRGSVININEPLTWKKLSIHVALAIHNLNIAARHTNNLPAAQFEEYTSAIVDAIRLMLLASGTVDKDELSLRAHPVLKAHHRTMMASLAKLILSTQTCTHDYTKQTMAKMLADGNELLLATRNFISTCEAIPIAVRHIDPHLLADHPKQGNSLRYTLDGELAENIEAYGNNIQESIDAMITTIEQFKEQHHMDALAHCQSDPPTCTTAEKAQAPPCCFAPQSQPYLASLSVSLFSQFRSFSHQTGQFDAIFDDINYHGFPPADLSELREARYTLLNHMGALFCQLQALTNDRANHLEVLNTVIAAGMNIKHTIETICGCVDRLAFDPALHAAYQQYQQASVTPPSRHLSNASAHQPYQPPVVPPALADHLPNDEDDADSYYTDVQTNSMQEPEDTSEHPTSPQAPVPQQPPPARQSSAKLKQFFGDEIPETIPSVSAASGPAEPGDHGVQEADRPWYLQYDYKASEIVFNMEGSVKGGTLEALVVRLTLHDYLDMNFINTFLLTYRSFSTSMQLLKLLEQRYLIEQPANLTPEQVETWTNKKLKLIRLRVFNVLKTWLEMAYNNEDDTDVLDELERFTTTTIRSTLRFSAEQLERLIAKRRASSKDTLKKMVLTLPMSPPIPILPRNRKKFRLLDLDPLEVARQMTIMDFKLYSAIRPVECLNKAWSREDDEPGSSVAINIRASIEYCNQVTSWVSDAILSQHEVKKRVTLIKFWVQVAERCRQLNNFNTCMAILSAFDNSAVGRLKRTWELVGTRTTQVLSTIRKLMGANRNFTEYRAIIHSINPPCIPFLGIYLQDLTFIEDGNADFLKTSKHMINFAKRAKTAEVIREIQQYQSTYYQLKPVDELQSFIQTNLQSTRDEEQLYNESLRLEPREREDEKITRLLQESGFL
ncbi:ras GEF [Hesseltinella vesiculosa]|uniref:Ras GEF n=1 Tax=Hesseltinella vesiculosa TaxID=101127 RepID=A0A1X2GQ53_9FUNG|nr:ras GEF [Hesseltinella vesiculosa]